jgi:hypothetical protein
LEVAGLSLVDAIVPAGGCQTQAILPPAGAIWFDASSRDGDFWVDLVTESGPKSQLIGPGKPLGIIHGLRSVRFRAVGDKPVTVQIMFYIQKREELERLNERVDQTDNGSHATK